MPKVVAGYKEEAKRTILQTAVEVFAEKGYQGATMDDVAKKLGVSKGAVYQYFPSKDVLFRELCGNAAKKVEEMIRTTFIGRSVRGAAEKYMEAELERMAKKQMLMFEALAESSRNRALDRMMRDNYSALIDGISDFLEGLKSAGEVREDLDTVAAARFLVALRHGVIVSVQQGLGRDQAKDLWLSGFDLVLGKERGLGQRL